MERSFEYAVVRAIPDPRKGEVINIGIVVFHAETVDVRLMPSLSKLMALDASIDVSEIRKLPDALSHWTSRFDGIDQKYEAIYRFGIVTLSEKGTFRVTPAIDYETQIGHLIKTLVLPKPKDEQVSAPVNRISTLLRDIFKNEEVLGKDNEDIHKHLIVPNFPIDANENLYSDFALKNGAYWFTETADFRARSRGVLDNTRVASLAAIKLVKAKKRFIRSKVKTFVIYAATHDSDVTSQLNLLSDYAGELINVQDKRELANYTQRILDVAGTTRQIGT